MPEQPTSTGPNRDDLGKVTQDLRQAGKDFGSKAVDELESAAEQTKQAGAGKADDIARTADKVADDLQEQAPLIAEYVRDAARGVERIGDALHKRTAGELLSSATEYGRQQPLLFFAGAAVLGFALSRVVRSGLAHGSSPKTETDEREAVNYATGIDV